jgi:hypothetical protein
VLRLGHQETERLRPGSNAVGSRQGEMRAERARLARPAVTCKPVIKAARERREIGFALIDP